MSRKVADFVESQLIKIIEENHDLPWRRPFSVEAPQGYDGHRYRGTNRALTSWYSMARSFSSPYFLTLKKVLQLGGRVKRSEYRSGWVPIVLWRRVTWQVENADGEMETRSRMVMARWYRVWNLDLCEDVPLPPRAKKKQIEFSPIERAEAIIEGYENRPSIIHGSSRGAYYVPSEDTIHLPKKEDFTSVEEYYGTLFHEAAHSTGHPCRLSRDSLINFSRFGDEKYGEEELVAEVTAAFLCQESGISNCGTEGRTTAENSSAYLSSWLKAIKARPGMLIKSAQRAQKAADHILGVSFDGSKVDKSEAEEEQMAA